MKANGSHSPSETNSGISDNSISGRVGEWVSSKLVCGLHVPVTGGGSFIKMI